MTQQTHSAPRIVILGGGFGGRDAAVRLARRLPAAAQITLIDRNGYTLYTPMLTEVAGRSVSPWHIQADFDALPSRIRVIRDEIVMVDLEKKVVTLAAGPDLEADHIVFALGSVTNFRGIEGAEVHSLTMKTLSDAVRARASVERNVRLAAEEHDPERRRLLLSVVVAGGGYTGVETIASLNDLLRDSVREHNLSLQDVSVTMVEPTERLMAEMPEPLATYAEKRVTADGIEVRTKAGVQKVEENRVTLTDGTELPFGLLIWDTGIIPNPLIGKLDGPRGKRGGIATDSTFRVHGKHGIWAIGDCAEIPKPYAQGKFFEPTAQNATREGTHVADNICAFLAGRPVRPFEFKQLGELAVIARHDGVANVLKVQVKGLLGWLMWRAIYVAKMPGLTQKLGILADWLRLAFGRQYVPVDAPRSRSEVRMLQAPRS